MPSAPPEIIETLFNKRNMLFLFHFLLPFKSKKKQNKKVRIANIVIVYSLLQKRFMLETFKQGYRGINIFTMYQHILDNETTIQ